MHHQDVLSWYVRGYKTDVLTELQQDIQGLIAQVCQFLLRKLSQHRRITLSQDKIWALLCYRFQSAEGDSAIN